MWYSNSSWLKAFTPFSWILRRLVEYRRTRYKSETHRVWKAPVPVCVVGNVTVGGTGKTPLVIWLCEWLTRRGVKVGLVSRGYGGKASKYPLLVSERARCREVGEENVMLHRRTGVPIAVDPNRVRATQFLLDNHSIDLVIADDGLQHYRLGRDIEIAVIDGARGIGNGLQLPFGPLREPKSRLQEVQWIVVKGDNICLDLPKSFLQLEPVEFVNVSDNSVRPIHEFRTQYAGNLRAIAAIGNPNSFQDTLNQIQIQAKVTPFRDHHHFRADELNENGTVIIVTEKDAQKIRELPMDTSHIWYLKVNVKFKDEVDEFLMSLLYKHGIDVMGTN
ncbi:MAG: tetraacyldisaccharide 4'-kinase [Gammaproteobacteria bacterium]|nr:tetraacyldisaccharide 4'-kinase [Gammaproteobacteria bacterium]